MKKMYALKALVTALVLCVALLGFARVEVWANAYLEVSVFSTDYDESISEGTQVAFVHNGVTLDYSGMISRGIMFIPTLGISDVPNAHVEFRSGILAGHIVPLSEFENDGSHVFNLFINFEQVAANLSVPVVPQPAPVDSEPSAPPVEELTVVLPITPVVQDARVLRFVIDSTTYTNNHMIQQLEAAPFVADGRTMVPLRVIAEAFGANDVTFNDGVISFSINGRPFTMTIGQPLPNDMGTPVIVNGRTFVPLAFISNEVGAQVRWDSNARAAYVYIN